MPYFDFKICANDVERDRIEGELNDWIKERIPNGADPNINIFYLMKILVASLAFHEKKLNENLHQMSSVRCTVFLRDSIPSSEYVRTACPWDATTDTVCITRITPHTLLLAETESLRSIIEAFKISLNSDIRNTLREELDAREVGGPGFVQSNIILSNIDQLLIQNQ